MARVTIRVRGRVQGVFFRDSAKKFAEKLQITGTVKNENDGGVSLICEGGRSSLEKFVEWCKNGGSSLAEVRDIDVEWEAGKNTYKDFKIIL